MKVAILDYGSGNLRSAEKAFRRAAMDSGISADIHVTAEPDFVRNADRIVLPGVGAFGACCTGLAAKNGMTDALNEAVLQKGRPFFGICVGMQLMASIGIEHGTHEGLNWIEGEVVRLNPSDKRLKIPHMGWNQITIRKAHPVLKSLTSGAHAYFVHSFGMRPADDRMILADVDYGGAVAAVVGRDNMIGTQFHPEKSQQVGLGLIADYLAWRP